MSLKSGVDPNFERQLKARRDGAAAHAGAIHEGLWEKDTWDMPAGFQGSLTDIETLGEAFSRERANQMFLTAIQDSQSPGVVGDSLITSAQVDYLACMERAFRMRHTMRRPRAALHAAARLAGHGTDRGTFIQCALEHVRSLIKRSGASRLV